MGSIVKSVHSFSSLGGTFSRTRPRVMLRLTTRPVIHSDCGVPTCACRAGIVKAIGVLRYMQRSGYIGSFLGMAASGICRGER